MDKKKQLLGFVLMGIGVLALIFGLICFSMNDGSYVSTQSYGGDAYTGIQNAAARTANNLETLTGNLITMGGFFFVITALILLVVGFGWCGLLDKMLNRPKVIAPAPVAPAANFDPMTGAPVAPAAPAQAPMNFDPMTGEPIQK
jgi:hypothetical protein